MLRLRPFLIFTSPSMRPIATIQTSYPEKFGVPRQSGLIPDTPGIIRFVSEFRNPDAVRGLEGFSHLWLIWVFSENIRDTWSPTVRPPRLGGNTRVGVFATRSPFRPNPIGLSAVKLDHIEFHPEHGPLLHVLGADLMDGTPILDIKPYLPFADCIPEATTGFASNVFGHALEVVIPSEWEAAIPPEHLSPLRQTLAQDPRPSYQDDPSRIYGLLYGGMDIKFRVQGNVLTLCSIQPL